MHWTLDLAVGLALVDFLSGLVHWAEDTFATETTPILGRWIVTPNVLHHADPVAFAAKSWIASSWDLVLASGLLLVLSVPLGLFGPGAVLLAVLGANANQLHKWCHVPRHAPRIVRGLWRIGLLQGPRHHARHHRGAQNQAYCVVTPFLNPLLDRLRFWRALERLTVPLFGAPRRTDLRTGADRSASD
ncbi:MAG: sterol desaturase family protein [Planctomycetes bacterium]|nr:sterol desaturase family protein [Planctomycetota bacterium]